MEFWVVLIVVWVTEIQGLLLFILCMSSIDWKIKLCCLDSGSEFKNSGCDEKVVC